MVRRDLADIKDLASFSTRMRRVVLASNSEPGARNQYLVTLQQLTGSDASSRLLAHEVSGFDGRIGVQHWDVPYALFNDLADGGIIFWPPRRFLRTEMGAPSDPEISASSQFPRRHLSCRTLRWRRRSANVGSIADAFSRFFLEIARTAIRKPGFVG